MSEITTFKITSEDLVEFQRLDLYLSNNLQAHSRNLIKKYFQAGHFKSDQFLELKKMPPEGTIITFELPEAQEIDLQAENIPLEILFEDEHLIIINKEPGMVVHPAPGNYTGTLVNAILYHCPDLKGIGNEKRPGIVHRLDKGTSGVMVVAKDSQTHAGLVDLFSTHSIQRQYEALVLGARIEPSQTIDSPLGRNPQNRLKMKAEMPKGKRAVTHLKVLKYFSKASHLQLTLETGRTHQIRVHLSQILNAPIINDRLYGDPFREKSNLPTEVSGALRYYEYPLLHARILGFKHPITQKELLFEQAPPKFFGEILSLLN